MIKLQPVSNHPACHIIQYDVYNRLATALIMTVCTVSVVSTVHIF